MEQNNTPGRLERIARTTGTILLKTTGAALVVGGAALTAAAGTILYDSFGNSHMSSNDVLPVFGFGSMFGISGLGAMYVGALMLLPKKIRNDMTDPNHYL